MKLHQTTLLRYLDPVSVPNYGHIMFVGYKNFVMTWFDCMPIQHDFHFCYEGELLEESLQ